MVGGDAKVEGCTNLLVKGVLCFEVVVGATRSVLCIGLVSIMLDCVFSVAGN